MATLGNGLGLGRVSVVDAAAGREASEAERGEFFKVVYGGMESVMPLVLMPEAVWERGWNPVYSYLFTVRDFTCRDLEAALFQNPKPKTPPGTSRRP